MPANFTETEKQEILTRLYEKGYESLKQLGLKKMNIRLLTAATGIATGTFYHFFSSKEDFVLCLIRKKRLESLNAFTALADKYPDGIPYEETCHFFYENLKNNNIYQYLTSDEYELLLQKCQDAADHAPSLTAEFIMSKLATKKGPKEYAVFNQSYDILIIGTSNPASIDTSLLDQALEPMVAAACPILF